LRAGTTELRILLTGGTGFLGSALTEVLIQNGFTLIIPTRSKTHLGRISHLLENASLLTLEGDIFNRDFLERIFAKEAPDAVVHLAWKGVSAADRDEQSQLDNIPLMQTLLQLCAKHKARTLICTGSQAEYGPNSGISHEGMRPDPRTLYAIAKNTCSQLGLFHARKHKYNFAWLRLFPTFGPKDNDSYLIPYVIKSFLREESPQLTGCAQRLDYLYVKDAARLILQIIRKKEPYCGIFNLCSGKSVRLKDFILSIRKLTGARCLPAFGTLPYRGDGFMRIQGSTRNFKKTFGWIKLTDRTTALRETIEQERLELAQKEGR
jgi:nucleoside-diphosphate-sugar epimerase